MLVTPYPDPMLMVVCMCVFGDSLACFEMGEYETAKAAFEQALKAPTTHASLQAPLRKWLRKCQAEIECTPLVGAIGGRQKELVPTAHHCGVLQATTTTVATTTSAKRHQ